MIKAVLILGSAPDAVRARSLNLENFDAIVAMNNAWQIRSDWTHLIYPEDFPPNRRPQNTQGKSLVTYDAFVPANNAYGGIMYAGGTMAFTSAYWVLYALKPDIIAFLGCDMIYDDEESHFYGEGVADPLRDDPTLQSLEAKSQRLRYLANRQGCCCLNLSEKAQSRLTFQRFHTDQVSSDFGIIHKSGWAKDAEEIDTEAATNALDAETITDCFVESGDYWNYPNHWDAKNLKAIDSLWLDVFTPTTEA